MGKSKKKKNADFQKIKLKVGKKLSKGDNVTNLSFKTRQIQLKQTIRTGDTGLPVTKKHLSIQDLLRQCDHHGVGVRVNAVSGIKELLMENFKDFLIPSNVHGYGAIMKRISSMLIDNESDVRHSVINLFKFMFSKLKQHNGNMPVDTLLSGGLFAHIHAYLCCAMNHIHEDVRLDALVLFDALLETVPNIMVQQTGDLLKNLISMISSPISIGTKATSVTQRLSMNPDSKLPVMKFRARVLLRIKLTLQVALLEGRNVDVKNDDFVKASNDLIWSVFFDRNEESKKQNTLFITKEQVNKFSLIFKGAAIDTEDYIMKASSLKEFIELAVPVLLQCWKEARATGPNDTANDSITSLDGLEVMSHVASVVDLMFTLSANGSQSHSASRVIPISFLTENYETCFTQDFMTHFPYASHIEVKTQKKRKIKEEIPATSVIQSSLASLNLCLCRIMSHFCTDASGPGTDRAWLLRRIQQFVVTRFEASPSPEHTRLLSQILRNVFQNPSSLDHFMLAFEAASRFYTRCKLKRFQKRELFNLFCLIFNQWDGYKGKPPTKKLCGHYPYSSAMEQILSRFVRNLPQLVQQVPRTSPADLEWVKKILFCISDSMNGSGLLGIEEEIKSHLTGVLGLLNIGDEEVQQKVLSLLAVGPTLAKDQLKDVLHTIRRPIARPVLPHRKSRSLACQAITYICHGIWKNLPLSNQVEFNQMTQVEKDSLSDFLKFMFSLLIGLNQEEMKNLYLTEDNETSLDKWKTVKYTAEKEQWDRHLDLAATVCQEVMNMQIPASPLDGYTQPFTFITNVEQLWTHYLTKYKNIHIMSAFSLLKFIQSASAKHINEKLSPGLHKLTTTVITSVLVSFYLPSTHTDKLTKEMIEQMKSEIIVCLRCDPNLVSNVWRILQGERDTTEDSNEVKQATRKAVEFLKSDEHVKTLLGDEISNQMTDVS